MTRPMKERVESRTKKEGKSSGGKHRQADIPPPTAPQNAKRFVPPVDVFDAALLGSIPPAYVEQCFYENRLGDGKLYNALHRGRAVYVMPWVRFLVWAGHHWQEDTLNVAYQNIAYICELYARLRDRVKAEAEAAGADKDTHLEAQKEAQANAITRRLNTLRDNNGMENILKMACRTQNPLVVSPDEIDKRHYVKACPNGVIDLRTGELRPGRPEEYLLNAIKTEYDPSLLDLDDPCPETSAFLLRSMDGDAEIAAFIWRLLGYGLITERKDHIFCIFWGEH